MKILIFNTLYYPNQIGGAEKSVQLLAEGLLKAGEEPIVVCTSEKDYIDYVNGVKVYYIKMPNLYWAYNSKEENKLKKLIWHLIDSYNPFNKKIVDVLDIEKPDVVHTNNLAGFSVNVWKLAKERDIKVVHTLRDYYLLCPKSTMFNEKLNMNCKKQCWACKIYSIPKKEISKYVDVVIGISKFILNKHLEYGYFKNAKKEVIYNSVEIPKIFTKKEKLTDKIIFGYVGSLSSNKGIEFLLKNFNKINIPNVKLYVYGKGITKVYEIQLKKKYKSDKILFKGFQKPEKIYTNIDILIVPSLWNEPFGRVVIEANSYGIPVLASNRGGIPELIENGKNGYIFDINNENFIEKLKLFLNTKFDETYIKNFSLNFTSEKIVKKYKDIYEDGFI